MRFAGFAAVSEFLLGQFTAPKLARAIETSVYAKQSRIISYHKHSQNALIQSQKHRFRINFD
jgi:hypothetical protein